MDIKYLALTQDGPSGDRVLRAKKLIQERAGIMWKSLIALLLFANLIVWVFVHRGTQSKSPQAYGMCLSSRAQFPASEPRLTCNSKDLRTKDSMDQLLVAH